MLNPSEDTDTIDKYGFIGGDQYSSFDADENLKKIRRRESKWLHILNNWDYYMTKKFDKLRNKCRKGISEGLRARVWQHLCGSRQEIFKFSGKYQELLSQPGEQSVIEQIARDVGRQYPQHEIFYKSVGKQALFNVLKAWSILQPATGYCQAQAPLAAALLIHMPEEEAFWTFCSLCQHYLPGYFDDGLERVQLDAKILYGLLRRHLPQAYKHLIILEVEPVYFMVDWFMCVFTRNFPWATVVRVLDMFFCEGIKVIFRVSMAMIKSAVGSHEARQRHDSTELVVAYLRNLPPEITKADFVVSESLKFANIPASEFMYEHVKQYRNSRLMDSTLSNQNTIEDRNNNNVCSNNNSANQVVHNENPQKASAALIISSQQQPQINNNQYPINDKRDSIDVVSSNNTESL